MGSDFQSCSLADIYDFASGLSKARSEFGAGHPFLSFKDVFYNSAVPRELKELVRSTEHEREKCSVRRGDVFLTRTSETMDELGMSCVALDDIPSATFNGFTKRLRPKTQGVIAPEYARYYFRSWVFRANVNSMATMSTRASLNNEMLSRLSISFPSFKEQQAIGDILGTLDDKIELNKKTNETLQGIAKALFKSWFVDFDPVRAKAGGRPTGLPDEISELFPDSFEDSELGQIPMGWRAASIYEISKVVYGAPFSSKLFNTAGKGIPLARIRDLKTGSPGVYTEETHPKGCLIEPGDSVVGMDGEFRPYLWSSEKCWMNQRVCKFVPSRKESNYFVRQSITRPLMDVELSETATTVIHLGKSDIDRFQIVLPSDEVLDAFNSVASPIEASVVSGNQQNTILSSLRDALLPRLISGELRVPDAEKMLEEVGI